MDVDNLSETKRETMELDGRTSSLSSVQLALASLKSLKAAPLPQAAKLPAANTSVPSLSNLKQSDGLDLKSLSAITKPQVKIDLKSLSSSQTPMLSSIASLQPNRVPSLSIPTVKLSSLSISQPQKIVPEPKEETVSDPDPPQTQPLPQFASEPTCTKSDEVLPSGFAEDLFLNDEIQTSSLVDSILASQFSSLYILPPSKRVFDFSTPSPDDVVASARVRMVSNTSSSSNV